MTMRMAGTPKAREKQVSSPKHGIFLADYKPHIKQVKYARDTVF
jgi:hypothetical protein